MAGGARGVSRQAGGWLALPIGRFRGFEGREIGLSILALKH